MVGVLELSENKFMENNAIAERFSAAFIYVIRKLLMQIGSAFSSMKKKLTLFSQLNSM
jgi:hypothetical protein